MAPNRKRGSVGCDSNQPRVDPGTKNRNESASLGSVCAVRASDPSAGAIRDPIDFRDPEAIYTAARAHDSTAPPDPFVRDFERLEVLGRRQPRDPLSGLELPRHPHLGSPMVPFPYLTAIAHGVEGLAAQAMKASEAFLEGVLEGVKDNVTPRVYATLQRKLLYSAPIQAAFPYVFAAGAAVGVLEDAYEAIKGLVELLANLEEMAKQMAALAKEVLQNPEAARSLGREVGKQFAADVTKLSERNLIRFLFELGRLVGPFLFYTLLSLAFGIGVAGLTLRGAKELVKVLRRYPKAAKILDRLEGLIRKPKGAKTRIHGKPDAKDPAAYAREQFQAQRFVRPDVDDVFFPNESKKLFGVPETEKWPDVLARKSDGSYALGEGKGTELRKAIKQFESAGKWVAKDGGRITEQEVTVQRLVRAGDNRDLSPGHGYRVDANGFLEEFDTRAGLDGSWVPARPNGVPIKVNVIDPPPM
jgi:hypothetical protein